MRTTQFVNGEFYHLYNRGVDKRDIFLEKKDYLKFLLNLYSFNHTETGQNLHLARRILQDLDPTPFVSQDKPGKLFVEIIAFCLIPNHYHLLVRQREHNGVVKLMQRLGTGYTMYVNKKYERTGVLFQGKFKSILVKKEEYLLALLNYIHLNPLDLKEYNWRENGIKNWKDWKEAQKFLENYRWSSYSTYCGKSNLAFLVQQEFVHKYFSGDNTYKDYIRGWLRKDIDSIQNLIFD